MGWVAIGDENYGEGSSREHAAMEPRFLGGRSSSPARFARIHETNLKKQGVLPLTFADPADYDLSSEDDRISVRRAGRPGARHTRCTCASSSRRHDHDVECTHTMSQEQIEWFKAGGALNIIRRRQEQSR